MSGFTPARDCRTCQQSTHSGDALVCTVRESPAWALPWYGLCSRATRSRAENARYDARCARLAAGCAHYTPEACRAESPDGYICTLNAGHRGAHEAHGTEPGAVEIWDRKERRA